MPGTGKRRRQKWKLGYRSEHFRIATQMAVAIVAAMQFVAVNKLYDFLGESVVWIVITVVVAFSPNIGAALHNAFVGVLGSLLGAGLGLLIIALVTELAMGFDYHTHPIEMSVWATFLMAAVGFVLALNKERFPRFAYGFNIALLTFPIVAIPGFRVPEENYVSRLKLSLCALIGVVITVAAAFVVFPIRARTRLRKCAARILERAGGLAFQLLGEFCEEPDKAGRVSGSSGTDERQHYVDDGLQRKYEAAHATALDLANALTTMAGLIGPARAEMRYLQWFHFRQPVPIATYKAISRMLARILTALGGLQHSLESGHLRLGLCVQNRQLLEELRQDSAAAFTALSGLLLGSTPEEYARAKMEQLSEATLALQGTLEALPLEAGYNVHVETLAIATKTATNVARQVASIYMELRPEAGARLHMQLCAAANAAAPGKGGAAAPTGPADGGGDSPPPPGSAAAAGLRGRFSLANGHAAEGGGGDGRGGAEAAAGVASRQEGGVSSGTDGWDIERGQRRGHFAGGGGLQSVPESRGQATPDQAGHAGARRLPGGLYARAQPLTIPGSACSSVPSAAFSPPARTPDGVAQQQRQARASRAANAGHQIQGAPPAGDGTGGARQGTGGLHVVAGAQNSAEGQAPSWFFGRSTSFRSPDNPWG